MFRIHTTATILLTLCLSFFFPFAASADTDLIPLNELIARADHVVIGQVSKVTSGAKPGETLATVDVDLVVLGPGVPQMVVRGSQLDPTAANPAAGDRILVFAKGVESPFDPVAGGHGVIGVHEEGVDATASLIQIVDSLGYGLRVADIEGFLWAQSAPTSRVLIASLLDELTARSTLEDAPEITQISCDGEGTYLPMAQLWAIGRAGTLAIDGTRPCLEEFTGDEQDRGRQLAAIQALGDLGAPSAAMVLTSLLTATPIQPAPEPWEINEEKETGGQPIDDDGAELPEGHEDPEDEFPGEPEPQDQDPSMEDPEDDHSHGESDDPIHRRSDSGLTEAAILALGKIGSPIAIPVLADLLKETGDLAIHSTIVHALGLIGSPEVQDVLQEVAETHPIAWIRDQAQRTLDRV